MIFAQNAGITIDLGELAAELRSRSSDTPRQHGLRESAGSGNEESRPRNQRREGLFVAEFASI